MANMEAQKRPDLFLIRGDSRDIAVTFSGVDLTGTTVFFTLKPALTDDTGDTTAVVTVEVTSHTDPANGSTLIPLSASDMEIAPGDYFYDIQIKNGATITSIPARKARVYADVTRRTS